MLSSSPTTQPLTSQGLLSESPSLQRPTTSCRPASQSTIATCTSYTDLVGRDQAENSWRTRVFGSRQRNKVHDSEKNGEREPPGNGSRRLALFHGWRYILFGSWFNAFILLIPVSWILKVALPESHSLVFAACILAMIPLVKIHDVTIGQLSARLGGSKTGLLNASLSNIVEMVVAIIALKECELRVVQSSLIGSMLSKLLLVLGMCFFAGGMRFTQQDFDTTATQIHTSLLSLSVGAVLLPAAFHFTLSYRPGEIPVSRQTSIEEQKKDILKMSRGVSIVLLCIYVAYLLFQFWSHSHHFKDQGVASQKLPNAVSVRSVASKVRPPSPILRKLRSPTPKPTPSPLGRALKGTSMRAAVSRSQTNLLAKDQSPPRDGFVLSPFAASSEVTVNVQGLATPAPPEASTVRLVQTRRSSSGYDTDYSPSSSPERNHDTMRSSFVSELVSMHFDQEDGTTSRMDTSPPGVVRLLPAHDPVEKNDIQSESDEDDPQVSWFLTLFVLTTVTILVAINADWLVDSMDGLSPTISKEWIGLILLPAVRSLAECVTAMNVSVQDKLTLSVSVAVGSTIQTALFVIPTMVMLGWILDKPLALLFDPFESIVLYISVNTMGYVVADGKSNWLEGIILICLYIVVAVSFWFYPGSNFSSHLAICYTVG